MAPKRTKLRGKAKRRLRARQATKRVQRKVGSHRAVAAMAELATNRSAAFKAKRKKQTTRLLKAACPKCGYAVRITKGWVTESGLPKCPVPGHGSLVAISPELVEAMEDEADE